MFNVLRWPDFRTASATDVNFAFARAVCRPLRIPRVIVVFQLLSENWILFIFLLTSPNDGVLSGIDLNVQSDFASADKDTVGQDQSMVKMHTVLRPKSQKMVLTCCFRQTPLFVCWNGEA